MAVSHESRESFSDLLKCLNLLQGCSLFEKVEIPAGREARLILTIHKETAQRRILIVNFHQDMWRPAVFANFDREPVKVYVAVRRTRLVTGLTK
jgi:hypothetical protein